MRKDVVIDLVCVLVAYAMSLFLLNDLPRTAPYVSIFVALYTVQTVRLERQIRALRNDGAAGRASGGAVGATPGPC